MIVYVLTLSVFCLHVYLVVSDIMFVEMTPKCSTATRRQHIRNTCRERNWSRSLDKSNPRDYWRLLVDDAHRVLYCVIPKVACSSFKTFIVNSTVNTSETRMNVHSKKFLNSVGLNYLSQLPLDEIHKRIANYHKVVVVRHPFDRLISAYKDKFVYSKNYPEQFAGLFKRVYQDDVPYDQFGAMRPTFKQFLGLVVNYYSVRFSDKHWRRYYDLCHPCDIRYDDVIKLETLEDDLESFTTRYTGYNSTYAFPILNNKRAHEHNKLWEVTRVFADVSPTIIAQLMKIYKKDFELYGYSWNSGHGAACDATRDRQARCC